MLPSTATTGGAKATQAAPEGAARDATQADAGDNVEQGCNDAVGCWRDKALAALAEERCGEREGQYDALAALATDVDDVAQGGLLWTSGLSLGTAAAVWTFASAPDA